MLGFNVLAPKMYPQKSHHFANAPNKYQMQFLFNGGNLCIKIRVSIPELRDGNPS